MNIQPEHRKNYGGKQMNIRLVKAWIDAGSPPLEDLAPAIGIKDLVLIRYMNGQKYPDKGTQQLLADIFSKSVAELFSDSEDSR